MLIINEITQGYDATAKYVQSMLPIMPRYVPKRYKAYEKYCTCSKLAEQGITWGKGPELIIDTIKYLRGHTAAGMFSVDLNPNALYFDTGCANKYEANPGKYAVAIQYTLLHELIHWARYHAKADAQADGKEAGGAFEIEAYGQDVSYLWGYR